MPRQTRSQELGRLGERWFQASLPPRWILQPPLDDVGVDGVVVICEPGPLNGVEFRVQIKSADRFTLRDETLVVAGLKRDSLMYWLTGFTPTLLVLYEVSSGRGFCEWVNRLVAADNRLLSNRSKTVSLRIGTRREITSSIWVTLGADLRVINSLVSRRILTSGKALPLLRALHALADALHGFDFAAHAKKESGPPGPDDYEVLCQLEVSCHRDVVRALRQLNADLAEAGVTIEGLVDFAAGYAEKCSSFITSFGELVDDPTMIRTINVNVSDLASRRAGFVRSIIAAMQQLTAIGIHVVPDANDSGEERSPAN